MADKELKPEAPEVVQAANAEPDCRTTLAWVAEILEALYGK